MSNLLLGEFECYQLSITLDLTLNINLHYDQLHFLHLQCENQIRGCIAGTCTTMMEMEFLTKMTSRYKLTISFEDKTLKSFISQCLAVRNTIMEGKGTWSQEK